MIFPRADKNIILPCQQFCGQRDHPSCMTEPPLERADQYVITRSQDQPDTLVFIPSRLTIRAIRLSSAGGTFASSPPSGVSLEMV